MINRTARVAAARSTLFSAPIETLEKRCLFSAGAVGPKVVAESFLGPPNAITAIVLQFNEHLNATTAQNPAAYTFGRHVSDNNSGDSGLLGLLLDEHPNVLRPDTSAGSIVYNDAAETVTLYPSHTVVATTFVRYIRIVGTGANAVTDVNGNKLEGGSHSGSNQIIHFRYYRTKTLKYTDADGDKVMMHLTGPGEILAFYPHPIPEEPLIFLNNTDPTASIVTGSVKQAKHGDGVAVIQEMGGTSSADVELGSEFQILYEPS
jgi:hypothetical protein